MPLRLPLPLRLRLRLRLRSRHHQLKLLRGPVLAAAMAAAVMRSLPQSPNGGGVSAMRCKTTKQAALLLPLPLLLPMLLPMPPTTTSTRVPLPRGSRV
jgi:hypothetical protein